jgi:TolB-like protein/Tfp pilus assembly protein PilF
LCSVAHEIFISHSAKDKDVADAICAELEHAGIRCWMAPRNVQPGRSFAGEITRAVQQSKVMVLVFSAHSNNSEQVLREVQLAVEAHLSVVQFRIEDVAPNDDLKYFLGTPHWLDASSPPLRNHIQSLLTAVPRLLSDNAFGLTDDGKKTAASVTSTKSPAPRRPISPRSIAVLPLVDLSQSKDQEYLCDGISEELLNTLAKVPGLRVAARTSAFSFKGKNVPASEIAEKLGVANLLEGSLRRDGSRIRVTAQLSNARSGFQLWSETTECELRDVFSAEDEITRAIVGALKIKLAGATATRKGDSEANDFYLQGLYFSNKSGEKALRKALSLFQKALDKDPKFSRAWTGVAEAWLRMADAYLKPLEAYPIGEAAAKKALALDERDPIAHCVLGFAKKVLYWDQEAMFNEARRALEIDPNSAFAHLWLGDALRGRGDLNGAVEEYRKAASLDPLSPYASDELAGGYLVAGRLDEAIAQGKHTLELDPTYAYLDSTLANAYREKGLFDEAIAIYHQGERFTGAPSRGLGIAYAFAGKRKQAEEVLDRFLAERKERYISAAAIGIIHGALGNKDEAFRWFEQAYNDHDAVLTTIAFYPGSQPLRRDPRFIDLVRRVGLDPARAIPA